MSTYRSDFFAYAFIDQPVKFTPNSTVVSADYRYTDCRVPPCVHDINVYLNASMKLLEYSTEAPHYPRVPESFNNVFYSCDTDEGATSGACLTTTQAGLHEWKRGTDNYTTINGKLNALIGWNDITADYTAEASLLRLPIFYYCGNNSLVPADRVVWAFNVSASNNKKLLMFEGLYATHTPFLNPAPSIDWFFGNLTEWIQSIVP